MMTAAHPSLMAWCRQQSRWVTLCALMIVFAAFIPQASYASTLTEKQVAQNFSCGGGGGGGKLISGGGGCGSPKDGKVLSYFVCNFETIVTDTLSDVYCSIVQEATPGVNAALTLAVVFFGMAMLMGVSPFTAKELMIMAGKFSMVLAFATQAEYMIGIGYKLFMSIAKEGIVIVISHLFEGQNFKGIQDVFEYFDKQIMDFFKSATKEAKDGNQCKNAIFALVALMVAAFPPLAFLGIYFLIRVLWFILRAVFGYCQGILGVTFLVTLAPIFVPFALFKFTRTLFDKWLTYLFSFSFQMVVVFAFLGMVFSIAKKSSDSMQDYMNLVKPYDKEVRIGGWAMPWDSCSICEIDKTSVKSAPKCKSETALPPSKVSQDANIMQFAGVKIIAMLVLFYILDIMMDFVPQMARHLAGPKYAGQIGGGKANEKEVQMNIPGEKSMDAFVAGFVSGFKGGTLTPDAMVKGFKGGLSQFLIGSRPGADGQKQYPGLIDELAPVLGFAGLFYGASAMGFTRGGAPGSTSSAGFAPTSATLGDPDRGNAGPRSRNDETASTLPRTAVRSTNAITGHEEADKSKQKANLAAAQEIMTSVSSKVAELKKSGGQFSQQDMAEIMQGLTADMSDSEVRTATMAYVRQLLSAQGDIDGEILSMLG